MAREKLRLPILSSHGTFLGMCYRRRPAQQWANIRVHTLGPDGMFRLMPYDLKY